MNSIKKSLLIIIILLLSISFVFAEENITNTTNQNMNNQSENSSNNNSNNFQNSSFITGFAVLEQNKSSNNTMQNNSPSNGTKNDNNTLTNNSLDTSSLQLQENISLLKVFPDFIKLGDAQINLQIENAGNTTFKNLEAVVTAAGFSTYEINTIDTLQQKEKGYFIVSGEFKKTGNLPLKIKIKDFIFYSNITVYDPFYVAIDIEKEKQKEEEKKKKLDELQSKIALLQTNFSQLEQQFDQKKNNDFDVSSISLQDLKTYIRNTQASLAVQDEKESNVNYVLAENEFAYQKGKIESAQEIKKSFKQTMIDNAILISTIVGGLVALITLVEILRRQKEKVHEKIKNINLKKETQIITNPVQENSEK